MKTKISHLGRSSVSVILAVMMLLSTMLIGTVSTVNAADLSNATKVYLDSTLATVNKEGLNTWSSICAYAFNTKGVNTYTDKNTDGKYTWPGSDMYNEGNGIYSIYVDNSATNIIFNNNDGKQTGDLTLPNDWKTTPMIYYGDGTKGPAGWKEYSASVKVADSVTLTANPTSVKVGNSVTLTPTVISAKSGDLTYTYNKISGGTATEVKNADNSLTVTPTVAGTYKYKVTVSADGYSPVTSTEVSFTVTAPVDYYLAGRIKQDGTDGWVQSINNNYKFTESDTEGLYYYESKYTPKQWSEKVGSKNLEQYFYIIDSSSNKYGSKDNQTDNTPKVLNSTDDKSTLEKISSTGNTKTLTYISNQENVSNVTFWLDTRNGNMQLYYTSATAYSVTFGSNDISMGSVIAKNGSSNISSGDGVAENREVTFTATANEGYKFDGWYSDAGCTTAIEGATGATYTTTVTADTTVYAKFVAETYNITVKENANCTVTVNKTAAYGSNVNVTVKAKDGYTVSSISVTNVNANDISGNETEGYTFKMPASNVEITPNVVAVEVTAPKVTLNTVTGESTASVKAKEKYPITAVATAGDAYSKITSKDISVSGGEENTNYTWAETSDGSGIYTFVALTNGTFTVTYTATATSINDATKSTSATATLKITATYTATQQAYVALEEYVNSVKNTTSDGYTTDSYAAFSAALTSAQVLLTGLPAADATNASDYINAKTALETAFNGLEKDVTYYIGGRFKGESWNPNRTDMQFVKVDGESNLYKYETNMTVSQLSRTVDNAKQYFFIHTGNGYNKVYYASSDGLGHTFHKNSINNQLTLKYYPTKADDEKNYIKFDDVADSSSNVVLYLDTSDKDNLKLYYSTEKYSVTVAEGVPASVDKTEVAKGEKVTVTATSVPQGQILDTVTVVGADNKSVTTTLSGNTATFIMPDQDVTVKEVTFRTAETYTVNFSSSDDKFGTVSAKHNGADFTSGTTVTEGDTVTFTANPSSGYTFKDWTVTVNNGTPETRTESSLPLTITADTTVVANFNTGTPSGYYLLCCENTGENVKFKEYTTVPLIDKGNGEYYADFNVANIPKEKEYYIIFSEKEDTYGVINDIGGVTVNIVNKNGFSFEKCNYDVQKPNNNNNNVGFAKVYIGSDSTVTGFTVKISNLNIKDKKITYDAVPKFYEAPADTVEITAKDGTIRDGFTDNTTNAYKTTAVLGNTTLSIVDGEKITISDSYMADGENRAVTAKKVPYGSTVTVTTKINPTATFAGHSGSDYYVKGFSVNGIFGGVLSQTEGKNHSGNEYTYTFKVNQEIYDSSKLEITPVYFLKNDEDCVYFYIENYDSAKQIWGNTPSCYVYYGNGTTTLEALGYYPGQPMVDYNGSIFTQIPKYIDNGGTKVSITGMTLNNYVWDDVHRDYSKKEQAGNAQTYDYDDFVKIADSGVNADNIIYRFKYNTHNNVPGATLDTSDTDADGWEVFLDYQNYPTDIFGKRIGDKKLDYKDTESVTGKGDYLSIISDGYQNNYIGQYATAWSIYNTAGNRVATIPSSALLYALGKSDSEMQTAIASESTPSDFLPGKKDRDKHWATFRTLYKDYQGVYAQINFEAAIQRDDVAHPGNRLDGRWYYTKSSQTITGEIKIQYANTLDDYNKVGGFQEDTFADENPSSIEGKTTGASAYFTDPDKQVRKLNTTADNTQDYKFKVTATSTAAYTFVGWYRFIDGDYKAINPSDMSSLTGAVTRNSDVTLVARYIKTPGGSMTFQHSLYKGENAGGGKATTKIQVVVTDSTGESHYDSGMIAGTASIDKTKIIELATMQDLTVTVTLYTTTKNLYDFKGYYSAKNTTDITDFAPTTGFKQYKVTGDRKEGLVTKSEYTFSFDEYYAEYAKILTADDAGTVYYNFYSDITSIKVPYKVQFSYTDRKGDQKYYNRAGYVDPENTSSYTIDEDTTNGEDVESRPVKVTLTDSFILTLAPYESNFAKDLTWKKPTDSEPFDSSLDSSIASAVVNSDQSPRTIHLSVFCDKDTHKPTSRDNENGDFELFTKGGLYEFPYGSVFYTSNGDGTYTYDITAPKTYKGKQFMYWEIYSDQECKPENLVIKAYNSEGHFSYVAYDNCWIVPVYEESSTPSASVKKVYTTTQFIEVTRNQWTAENADSFTTGLDVDTMTKLDEFKKDYGEDKLYADFVLNFFYNGKQLSTFDPNSENVQAGVLIQRLDLDNNDTNTGYITDLNHYKYNETVAKSEAIKKITTGESDITSVKQQIDNNRLDNKNRLQYYTRFNNVKGNNDCVFRLYTYVQYTDADDQPVVELSNPVYFTFYDIANK